MSTKYYAANVPGEEQLYAEWSLMLYISDRRLHEMTQKQYKTWFPGAPLNYEACQKKIRTNTNIPVKELLHPVEWKRLWEGREICFLLVDETPVYIGKDAKFPVKYSIDCTLEGERRDLDGFPDFVTTEIWESVIFKYQDAGRIPLIRVSEFDIAFDCQTDDDCEYLLKELTENAKDTWMKPFNDGRRDLKLFYAKYFDENGVKKQEAARGILDHPLIYDACVALLQKYGREATQAYMEPVMDKLRPLFLEWLENDYRKRFIDASDDGK